eukprot:5330012-Amphidinium_carterae.1
MHARFKRLAQEDGRYKLSRFEPRLKLLLEQLAARKLSPETFPSFGSASAPAGGGSHFFAASAGTGTAGGKSNSWAFTEETNGGGPAVVVPVTQRILVFIMGGVTFSELRAASEVAKDCCYPIAPHPISQKQAVMRCQCDLLAGAPRHRNLRWRDMPVDSLTLRGRHIKTSTPPP